MVKLALKIKISTLENIEELKTSGSDFQWYLKFACSNCGEVSDKWSWVSENEAIPNKRGNTVNHFVSKCKLCLRENTMSIVEGSTDSYTADDQGSFKTIVAFDCRGLEATDFSPRGGWTARAINGGKTFTDVDLSEGEWADYCEKIASPVGIYDVEHKFEKIK